MAEYEEAGRVSRAVKASGEWIAEAIKEVADAPWDGRGLAELVAAVERIGEVGQRIAAALETIAESLETGRDEA